MGDKATLETFIKLIVFLPFIIFLIYLLFKFGGPKLQEMQNGRYMKILDRMPLSKDNNLLIVKIGEKAYVVSSSQGKVEIHMELSEEEIRKVEMKNNIPQYTNLKDAIIKLKTKKEDKQWEEKNFFWYFLFF